MLRVKVMLLCVLATAAIVAVAKPALACPPCATSIQFYADSACQNQVGWREHTCTGSSQGGNVGAQYMSYQQYEPCCANAQHQYLPCDANVWCLQRY